MQPARLPLGQTDRGAVAVEFALLLPLLMMILFGIMQYGYGLYQYQAFTSAMNDSGRLSATGVRDCDWLKNAVESYVRANGLNAADVSAVKIKWLSTDGAGALVPTSLPERLGTAELTASYTPLDIGIPLVPFPSKFTNTQQVLIQTVATGQTTLDSSCLG